jgi:hypothetical protein
MRLSLIERIICFALAGPSYIKIGHLVHIGISFHKYRIDFRSKLLAHKLSLAFLTLASASPVEAIDIAEQCGFDHVGLRLLPAAPGEPDYPLLRDSACLSDTLARLADSAVTVSDVEIARLGADVNLDRLIPLLDRAAVLGARHVLTAGDDPDISRLTDTFARFCALAGSGR